MRRPAIVFAAIVTIAVLGLAAVALTDRQDEAFTLGVAPATVAADLGPDARACQEGIDVPSSFSTIEVQVGTYERPGEPLTVTVHEENGSGRLLAWGSLPGGYPDVSRPMIQVSPGVDSGQRVAVCVEARGARRTALYGNAGVAAPASSLRVDDRAVDTDLALVFRSGERSLAAELPDTFGRAALFKASWIGPWTFCLLGLAVLVLVPVALLLAMRQLPP
jgi:hypothetical protein